MPAGNTTSDLLLLSPAAASAGLSRKHFWRMQREQLVPPPIMANPRCRWSRRQIERWLRGELQVNDDGLWYVWDADKEHWKLLPNQYASTLPNRAA